MDASRNDRGAITRLHVAALCESLNARAAGYWQLDAQAQRLVQVAFVPSARLDPLVGLEFAATTLDVELGQENLGIVAAASEGRPVVGPAVDLPEDSGSGRWLRAFVKKPLRGRADSRRERPSRRRALRCPAAGDHAGRPGGRRPDQEAVIDSCELPELRAAR